MYSLSAPDADVVMCRCEGGVELALQYAKMWCRYAKDLLTWIDKRISLGKSPPFFYFFWTLFLLSENSPDSDRVCVQAA